MSWMGGASANGGADLSPLRGRNVILWPDADQPGRDVMARIAKRLSGARTLDTDGLPDGFDAADLEALPDDPAEWLTARLRETEKPSTAIGRILTGAAFIARHVPPVWLIEGVVQRSRLYVWRRAMMYGPTRNQGHFLAHIN
jgi:hypothetical protein